MITRMKQIDQRFENSYIPEPNSGCWLWIQQVTMGNYGRFIANKKRYQAHRFSFELYKKPISIGLSVCHSCDNTLCVNPDHLFEATQKENMQDMIKKKRAWFHKSNGGRNNRKGGRRIGSTCPSMRGNKNPNSKLTEDQVRYIRSSTKCPAEISLFFGIGKTTVRDIRSRRLWKYLPD